MEHLLVIFCGLVALVVSLVATAGDLLKRVNQKYGEDSIKLQDGSDRLDPFKVLEYWHMYFHDEL